MVNKLDSTVLDFFSRNGNSQRIAEIYKVYKHIEDFVSSIMECSEETQLKRNLCSMKMTWKTEYGFVKYFFPDTENKVMLTVFFRDKIFSTNSAPHIYMVFEVQDKYKKIRTKTNRNEDEEEVENNEEKIYFLIFKKCYMKN